MHGPVNKSELPSVVICDLDGTIADLGDRDPYKGDKVFGDTPRYHVLLTLKSLLRSGISIVFFSGRANDRIAEDVDVYSETFLWLREKCGFSRDDFELYMRASGDSRRDSIVKRELYDLYIKDYFHVVAVFDDRPQVIRECWYKLGLQVFNCGDINAGDY